MFKAFILNKKEEDKKPTGAVENINLSIFLKVMY